VGRAVPSRAWLSSKAWVTGVGWVARPHDCLATSDMLNHSPELVHAHWVGVWRACSWVMVVRLELEFAA
jgi:hypothetical protein